MAWKLQDKQEMGELRYSFWPRGFNGDELFLASTADNIKKAVDFLAAKNVT